LGEVLALLSDPDPEPLMTTMPITTMTTATTAPAITSGVRLLDPGFFFLLGGAGAGVLLEAKVFSALGLSGPEPDSVPAWILDAGPEG
jgi:hypothetical protein